MTQQEIDAIRSRWSREAVKERTSVWHEYLKKTETWRDPDGGIHASELWFAGEAQRDVLRLLKENERLRSLVIQTIEQVERTEAAGWGHHIDLEALREGVEGK